MPEEYSAFFSSKAEDLITALRSGGLADDAILRLCRDMDLAAMRSVELDEIQRLILDGILNFSPRLRSDVIATAAHLLG